MKTIVEFLKDLTGFFKALAGDDRVPDRDKKVLLGLVALVISPIDLIPDWIPVIGLLDDVVYLAFIFDYLFNVLEDEILLSHYPWGMKSFGHVRRVGRLFASLAPSFITERIWKYQRSIYNA